MEINLEEKRLTLSAGELARLVAQSAESSSPLSLALRGKLGADAHRSYQELRKTTAEFRQEVHLDVRLFSSDRPPGEAPDIGDWEVRLRGRLDGLVEELDRSVVEELKTVALSASQFAAISPEDFPRHRLQIEIYLYMLALAHPEKIPVGKLIYLNLPDGRKKAFEILYNRQDIEATILEVIAALIDRQVRLLRERQQKLDTARRMQFPFRTLRPGQQEMISAIRHSLDRSASLLLEAPTGLGKTAAALFALLPYALEHDKQVLFLTSKTTQQALVYDTAQALRAGAPFPRILLLRARQKLCPLEEAGCTEAECPYLENFYLRLRRGGLLKKLLEEGSIHPDHLRELGERDRLCPHELQMTLAEEADLIIGDYNYAFDPDSRLERLFSQGDSSRLILLVDEAHNLPERARSYYSPRITWESVQAATRILQKEALGAFEKPLLAIQSQFEYYLKEAPAQPDPYPIQLSLSTWQDIAGSFEEAVVPYWYKAAGSATAGEEDPVLELHRSLSSFVQIMDLSNDNFAHLLRRAPGAALEIFCLDAAPYLQAILGSVHASILISATLQPFAAYARLLGLNPNTENLTLSNPFPQENCRFFIDPSVTTLYRERDRMIGHLAERINLFHALVKKNMLVFFPSFDLLRRIAERLSVKKLFIQEEGLSDQRRQALLDRFKKCRHAMLCSVMGGVFAEGIDLPGAGAEAAIVVGVALPQVCAENELLRNYFERTDNLGFEYAYLYPGMRRVIQAVGRLIRGEQDRGLVLLLDRRFSQKEYQRLFPAHWYRQTPEELVCREWPETISGMAGFYKGRK